MVEREAPGGQAGQSSRIENYLGFPAGLSGSDLARRATDQARRLGAELLTVQEAVGLRAEGSARLVELSGGGMLSASCVLVASGVSYRQLDTPGFAELTGAGIYYGAAMTEARALRRPARGRHRRRQLRRPGRRLLQRLRRAGHDARARPVAREVDVALPDRADRGARPTSRCAPAARPPRPRARTDVCDGCASEDRTARSCCEADACFVFIGASPRTDWLEGVVARDERGFILAGRDAQANGWPLQREPYVLETTVPGVFVAGDVRARSIKRVASAVGEGSMAVSLIHEYLVEA